MRNKFAATCARCGSTVAALEGETNLQGERWLTVHGHCPTRSQGPVMTDLERLGLHGREYDAEFYSLHGMTQADFRDAVNPDEGDR
jgi:hypothetical protein